VELALPEKMSRPAERGKKTLALAKRSLRVHSATGRSFARS
jgi:hypothetical protein